MPQMYSPKYTISNGILKNIGQVEAAKEIIDNAPLVPDFERDFRNEAIVKTVYHGTHIEGNDLTMEQTKELLEGQEIYGRDRDVQEVINYRNVVKIINDLAEMTTGYDLNTLLEIHKVTVDRIVAPEKAGALRKTEVVIKDESSGSVIMQPPAALEVPRLLNDVFMWLNSPEANEIHPVIRAGIAHYTLVSIHPFVDGNGRAVRAFANLILLRENYDMKKLFALEEHFDRDLNRYYDAFLKVDSQSSEIAERDLTPWLEYFTETVAVELTKIKEKVRKISIDSRMKVNIGQQVALSARQMKLIEYLSEQGSSPMRDLREVVPMVSEDTILRDLKDLQKKGIIDKEGSTKAARYVLKT